MLALFSTEPEANSHPALFPSPSKFNGRDTSTVSQPSRRRPNPASRHVPATRPNFRPTPPPQVNLSSTLPCHLVPRGRDLDTLICPICLESRRLPSTRMWRGTFNDITASQSTPNPTTRHVPAPAPRTDNRTARGGFGIACPTPSPSSSCHLMVTMRFPEHVCTLFQSILFPCIPNPSSSTVHRESFLPLRSPLSPVPRQSYLRSFLTSSSQPQSYNLDPSRPPGALPAPRMSSAHECRAGSYQASMLAPHSHFLT